MYTNIILGINKGSPMPKSIHKVKINNAVRRENNVGKGLRAYLEQINTQEKKYKPQNNTINLSQTLSIIPETNEDFISTHSSKSIEDKLPINKKVFKPIVKNDTFNDRKFANIICITQETKSSLDKKITHCLNKTNNTNKMKKQEENQRLKKDQLNKQEKLKNLYSVIKKQHEVRVKNLHFMTNTLKSQQKQIEQLNKNNTTQQQIIQLQEGVIQNFQQKQKDYEEQIKKLLNINKLYKNLPYKQDYKKRILEKINKEYNLFNTTNYSQTNQDFCSTL